MHVAVIESVRAGSVCRATDPLTLEPVAEVAMPANSLPDAATLHQVLRYVRRTGKLFWRERPRHLCRSDQEHRRWNARYAGKEAFIYINGNGYRYGSLFGQLHMAHRVIWKMETGRDPPEHLDHEDHNRLNNRIGNLKETSDAGNAQNHTLHKNNKSGVPGVYFYRKGKKWRAEIGGRPNRLYLGQFETFEAAVEAKRAAEVARGYHPNHGRQSHGRRS